MKLPIEQAYAYTDAMPPAVAGEGGHPATFRVAIAAAQGFGLDEAGSFAVLERYNERCLPPWQERDLRHKARSAINAPSKKPPGYLLNDRSAVSLPRRSARSQGVVTAPAKPFPPLVGGSAKGIAAVSRLLGIEPAAKKGKDAPRVQSKRVQPNQLITMITLSNQTETSSLDLSTLERIRALPDGKHSARCPICAEEGADRSGTNLVVRDSGTVTCYRDDDHGFEVKRMLEGDGWRPDPRPVTPKPRPVDKVKPLTGVEVDLANRYCRRLAGDLALCRRIGEKRAETKGGDPWRAETIRGMALDGDLGYTTETLFKDGGGYPITTLGDGGKLLFCYEQAVKARGADKRCRWWLRKPRHLWRGAWLTLSDPDLVFITEGEPAAIELIDRGFDDVSKGSLVVALPSAGAWRGDWGALLKGRRVILIPDTDDAGEKGMAAAARDIEGLAASVEILKFWEVAK